MRKDIPMEHTPDQARFGRIEAAQEKTAESLAYLFDLVGKIGDGTKALLTAQVLMVDTQTKADDRMAKLAETITATEAKRAAEHDDLKDKLHVLYEVVDNWIREHGGGGKNGAPAA